MGPFSYATHFSFLLRLVRKALCTTRFRSSVVQSINLMYGSSSTLVGFDIAIAPLSASVTASAAAALLASNQVGWMLVVCRLDD